MICVFLNHTNTTFCDVNCYNIVSQYGLRRLSFGHPKVSAMTDYTAIAPVKSDISNEFR